MEKAKNTLNNNTKRYFENYFSYVDEMIENISNLKESRSISNDFIGIFLPYNIASIKISKNILEFSSNIDIQQIAAQIITQGEEFLNFASLRRNECKILENSNIAITLFSALSQNITDNMFKDMKAAPLSEKTEFSYIKEMIPHRMGGIRLCETVLKFDICPYLFEVANTTLQTSKEQIRQLQLLNRLLFENIR